MAVEKEKKDLRISLLEKLLSLAQEEIKRRSKNVEQRLSSLPIYKEAKVIMAYYPLKGEVDILEMIRKANKKRFCFPVMDLKTGGLRAFEVSNLDTDFIRGPFGVREPDRDKAKEVDIAEIDLVIVPGLGFDHKRNRLGRGAGFYDRFLKKIKPPTKKVGIAFDFQILESLPIHQSLDETVDVVVGENFQI
ncbi:MAG: 5-formyltetrahydrofolate cyclo-ligase [Candidatus Omnitrophica bacterium]|nr:5-formyltetrahydrofolate cyclo-ligase [Candidatus Omnitrophota bacterium]